MRTAQWFPCPSWGRRFMAVLIGVGLLIVPWAFSLAEPLHLTYNFAVETHGKSGKEIFFVSRGVTLKGSGEDHGMRKKVQWEKTGLGIKKKEDKNQINKGQTLILALTNPSIIAKLRTVNFQLLDHNDGVTITLDGGVGGTLTLNPVVPTNGDPSNDRGSASMDVTAYGLQGREMRFTVPDSSSGAGYSLAGLTLDVTTIPVSGAGSDQTVSVNETVYLDGSGSTDANGDRLTFAWSFLSKPHNSNATLSDPSAVRPTFLLDKPGVYLVQLLVDDGTVKSLPDSVSINTRNSPPVADAGLNQTVFVAESVLLDGTLSHDVDHDPLTYRWRVISMPKGGHSTLSDPTSPTPSFKMHPPGRYVLELIVNDGLSDSEADQVVITTANSVPVANPGSEQIVNRKAIVQLEGGGSSDANNDPLTYSWSFTTIPEGSTAVFSDSLNITPTFVADRLGLYVAQLIVNDGEANSIPQTVVITAVNTPPVADAGPDQLASVGTIVSFDGGQSSDLQDDPLTYQWILTHRPINSTAAILNPGFVSPTLVPDLPGRYVVSLRVNDGVDVSEQDMTVVTVEAVPPVPLPGLLLTNPLDGAVVSFSPIPVSGLVSDPGATVTVNGHVAQVLGGTFLVDALSLEEGINPITVTANDGAGNTHNVDLNVTLSQTAKTHMDPIVGPTTWVKQQVMDETFTTEFANCEFSGQYHIVVHNGTPQGTERVNRGTVSLNGVSIIGVQELTGDTSQIIKPVRVQPTNELVVDVQGDVGSLVQVSIECAANCLEISIDEPERDGLVNNAEVMVQGRVTTSSGNPVGVIVNQQVAKVAGLAYAIDGIPVRGGTGTSGPTMVVAQVTNVCDQRATTAIQVNTPQASISQVQLGVTPDRNIAPSIVDLRLTTELEHSVATIVWDYEGDGLVDIEGTDVFEQTVTYTQSGIYTPRVVVTDSQGATFEARAVVLVEDAEAFEAMRNVQWSGMINALVQGEVEQALSTILIRKREVMRHDWRVLKDHLGGLASTFSVPLHLTDGRGMRVVLKAPMPLILGGVEFPLEVEFVLDTDGRWRIRNF